MKYVVTQPLNKDLDWYIAAPSGWMRTQDGMCRDRSCSPNGGPEMTANRNRAYLFASHRAAARQAGYLHNAAVREVER